MKILLFIGILVLGFFIIFDTVQMGFGATHNNYTKAIYYFLITMPTAWWFWDLWFKFKER